VDCGKATGLVILEPEYGLCCISGVGVCVVWCHTLCVDVCVVMYIVYVYVIEEKKKALVVCWVWQPIWCVYRIRTKVEAKN